MCERHAICSLIHNSVKHGQDTFAHAHTGTRDHEYKLVFSNEHAFITFPGMSCNSPCSLQVIMVHIDST
jgi:hypothetical protein